MQFSLFEEPAAAVAPPPVPAKPAGRPPLLVLSQVDRRFCYSLDPATITGVIDDGNPDRAHVEIKQNKGPAARVLVGVGADRIREMLTWIRA